MKYGKKVDSERDDSQAVNDSVSNTENFSSGANHTPSPTFMSAFKVCFNVCKMN